MIPLVAVGYQFECTGTYHSPPVHVGETAPVLYEPDHKEHTDLSPPSVPVSYSHPKFPGGYKLRKPKTFPYFNYYG